MEISDFINVSLNTMRTMSCSVSYWSSFIRVYSFPMNIRVGVRVTILGRKKKEKKKKKGNERF